MTPSESAATITLPLFPLKYVLFPQGQLTLQVFEARYLDLVSACLKTQAPFGVVTLEEGHEVRVANETPRLSPMGTLAVITATEADKNQVLHLQCLGTQRFSYASLKTGPNGLWIAQDATLIAPDLPEPIPAPLQHCSDTLQQITTALIVQGKNNFAQPYQFADAGWVANRWAELLPLDTTQRLELLQTTNPVKRLTIIAEHLQQAHISG